MNKKPLCIVYVCGPCVLFEMCVGGVISSLMLQQPLGETLAGQLSISNSLDVNEPPVWGVSNDVNLLTKCSSLLADTKWVFSGCLHAKNPYGSF